MRMNDYEWRKAHLTIRPGDHIAYYARYQETTHTIHILSGDMLTHRVPCDSIEAAQNEITRVLENAQAVREITEAK